MQNTDFEQMMQQAVVNLQGPGVKYQDFVENRLCQSKLKKKRFVPGLAVIACGIFLIGTVTFAASGGFSMWMSGGKLAQIEKKYDIQLPDVLGDESVGDSRWGNLAPSGTSDKEALTNPNYKVAEVSYFTTLTEETKDANGIVSGAVSTFSNISVWMGSTKEQGWLEFFSYDAESMQWAPTNKNGQNYRFYYGDVQSVEYKGYVLFEAEAWLDYEDEESAYSTQSTEVTWLDTERSICMKIECMNTSLDEALSYAKQIIDLN